MKTINQKRPRSVATQLGVIARRDALISDVRADLLRRWDMTLAEDGSTVTAGAGKMVQVGLQVVEQTHESSDVGTGHLILSYGPAGNRTPHPEPRAGYAGILHLIVDGLADHVKAVLARTTGNPDRDKRTAASQAAAAQINADLGLYSTSGAYAYTGDTGHLRVQIASPCTPEAARALLELAIKLGVVRK